MENSKRKTHFPKNYNDLIDQTVNIEFSIYKDTQAIVQVKEPQIKTPVDLISELYKAVENYGVGFTHDGINFDYTDDGKGGTMVRLSDYLETIFGIPKNTWFRQEHESYPSYTNIDFGISSKMVYCDLVQPQHIKGSMIPVERFMSQDSESTQFTDRCYLPVNFDNFGNVEVKLLDENFRHIKMTRDSMTFITLHVKSVD